MLKAFAGPAASKTLLACVFLGQLLGPSVEAISISSVPTTAAAKSLDTKAGPNKAQILTHAGDLFKRDNFNRCCPCPEEFGVCSNGCCGL